MLSDADNEDDVLDQLEQEDAFGRPNRSHTRATVHRMLKALVVKRDKVK